MAKNGKREEVKTPEPGKEDNDGLLCPRCKFKMNVYITKPLSGAVFRVRICKRCGERMPTEEQPV